MNMNASHYPDSWEGNIPHHVINPVIEHYHYLASWLEKDHSALKMESDLLADIIAERVRSKAALEYIISHASLPYKKKIRDELHHYMDVIRNRETTVERCLLEAKQKANAKKLDG